MSSSSRLDLSFLRQALKQFDTALGEYASEPGRRAYRDSAVMHFLLTYELSIQAIKRYLELQSLKESELPDISFQTIIRRADDLGILRTGWPGFSKYRDARNTIAHTYNEQRALAVVELAKDFALEARFLLDGLERRHTDDE
jgi:nucleotidyltransferase substrate binding protein (TIGR01987 family)